MKSSKTKKYYLIALAEGLLVEALSIMAYCLLNPNDRNIWMMILPLVFLGFSLVFCKLMLDKLDAKISKINWIWIIKLIKLATTFIILMLYVFLVKQAAIAVLIVTGAAYIFSMATETWMLVHYQKELKK